MHVNIILGRKWRQRVKISFCYFCRTYQHYAVSWTTVKYHFNKQQLSRVNILLQNSMHTPCKDGHSAHLDSTADAPIKRSVLLLVSIKETRQSILHNTSNLHTPLTLEHCQCCQRWSVLLLVSIQGERQHIFLSTSNLHTQLTHSNIMPMPPEEICSATGQQ